MATQKVDRFCHSCGELYDEDDLFCEKCGHKRKPTPSSEGVEKEGTLCWPPWLAEEEHFGFQI